MDWTLILPPILTAIVTYIVAVKRSRLKQAQVMAEIQANAIRVVAEIEEKLRKELKVELDDIKSENLKLHNTVVDLQGKLSASDHLIEALREEISALKSTIDLYKDEMARNKKRLADLENGNGH